MKSSHKPSLGIRSLAEKGPKGLPRLQKAREDDFLEQYRDEFRGFQIDDRERREQEEDAFFSRDHF